MLGSEIKFGLILHWFKDATIVGGRGEENKATEECRLALGLEHTAR